MAPHQERVVAELAELNAKRDAMVKFMLSPMWDKVAPEEQALICEQSEPCTSTLTYSHGALRSGLYEALTRNPYRHSLHRSRVVRAALWAQHGHAPMARAKATVHRLNGRRSTGLRAKSNFGSQ